LGQLGELVRECVHDARRAHFVDMYVVHHREQPGAQVGAAAVEVQLRPRTLESVLHQVVGGGPVADESSGIAAQPRDQLDQALGFVHRREQGGSTAIPSKNAVDCQTSS